MAGKYLFSYDIFDTVITRRTANPHGIFVIMQNKLLQECKYSKIPREIINNFYELRISSERLARDFFCSKENEEITLDDIYYTMNTSGLLSEEEIQLLIQLEIDTEIQNCLGIKCTIDEIERHVENGDRVVLISDMYLDETTVRKMLSQANESLSNLPIYLSSCYKKTKQSGNLYREVMLIENVETSNWLHKGDNKDSDIKNANKFGIKTSLMDDARLISIERYLLNGYEDDLSTQILVGASKNTRLTFNEDEKALIGSTLGGFLLVPYVFWIINDAQRKNINNLYFISRDGYILKKIADVIIDKMGMKIGTKYIYGSRKAWRMPSKVYDKIDFKELLNVSMPDFIGNIKGIADVFDLSLEELLCFLPEHISENISISRLDVDIIFMYLADNDEFVSYVQKKQLHNLIMVQKYLNQEIDFDEKLIAFVEVGGTGYTQRCLEKIIQMKKKVNIMTYFFQLYSWDKSVSNSFVNFYPDKLDIKDAIEPLCRALHDQTVAYEDNGGIISPVLAGREGVLLKNSGYEKYIEGILNVTNILVDYYTDLWQVDFRIIRKAWKYYIEEHDESILNFVGDMPFEVTGNGVGVYAPRLTLEKLDMIFKGDDIYEGASLDFSILRMSTDEKKYFNQLRGNGKKHNTLENVEPVFAKIPKFKSSKNCRVVIYGAGKLGQLFWKQLSVDNNIKVAAWVDKNYLSIKDEFDAVEDIHVLNFIKYDLLIIAIISKDVARQVEQDLLKMGVEQEKIIWITPEEYILGKRNGEFFEC